MFHRIHGRCHATIYLKLFIWCFGFVLFGLRAETVSEYLAGDEILRKDPQGIYQEIVQRDQAALNTLTQKDKLLFLLRKAQAERLLNYFAKFKATMVEIDPLIQDDTPTAILCRFTTYMGIAARMNSEYVISETLLNKAFIQAKAAGFVRMKILIKQELAYTHAFDGLYDVSLKDLQEAYVAAFKLDDDYLIAIINETYGAIYGYTNDIDRSIEYYQKAHKEYKRLGYHAHVGNALFGLASSYRFTKEFDKAISYFERYNENASYASDLEPSFYGLYGIAMTLAEKGDCEKALKTIDKALSLKGIDDYDAELYKSQARCLILLNRLPEAEVALKYSSDIFDTIPEVKGTKWYLELTQIASQLAFAKGNKDKAYELLNQYYEALIKTVQSNNASKLIKTQAMMEIDQRNVELTLLQQRGKVQSLLIEQTNQKNKQLFYLVILGCCLIIVVFGVLFFQRNYNNKLLYLSTTDSLTGLYNRHYIFDYLTKIVESSAYSKNSVSVILLDIDGFKQLNDTYGHPFGDYVIKTLSDLVQETLRIGDVMGRLGGEEFFCVLPRATKQQSVEISQRITKTIYRHEFTTPESECVNISVSIGIANTENETDMFSADILYSQADQALSESKRLGKNKVSVFNADEVH